MLKNRLERCFSSSFPDYYIREAILLKQRDCLIARKMQERQKHHDELGARAVSGELTEVRLVQAVELLDYFLHFLFNGNYLLCIHFLHLILFFARERRIGENGLRFDKHQPARNKDKVGNEPQFLPIRLRLGRRNTSFGQHRLAVSGAGQVFKVKEEVLGDLGNAYACYFKLPLLNKREERIKRPIIFPERDAVFHETRI